MIYIYAYDLAIIAPTVRASSEILRIFALFAVENHILFTISKVIPMVIPVSRNIVNSFPNIYLSNDKCCEI